MSYPTQPAFIYTGTWSDETRKHPAVKWLENYTRNTIDGQKWKESPTSLGMSSDWTLQKSTGEVVEGADKAWSALGEVYAPFKEHIHDPKGLAAWDTNDGWQMYGVADVWFNLQVPGDGGMKGPGGKQWDGMAPGAFKFTFRKVGEDGIELTRTDIFTDPSAALIQMLKRGMLKPEQLMG